jgi:DNA-binding transcriptional ArsR family regulator
MSYHLRTLREAGLVTSTAMNRANSYRLAQPDLDKLAALVGGLEPGVSPNGIDGPT